MNFQPFLYFKKCLRMLFLLSLVALVFSCGPRPSLKECTPPVKRLQLEIEHRLQDPAFDTAIWGIVIQSLENGEYIYLKNPYKGFMPASNMKLFTTAAALIKLGAEFRYETSLLASGKIENGVLYGDLIVKGSGDPSLCGRYHQDDPIAVFRAWTDSLKAMGIQKVEGRIIGDDNAFEDEIMGAGWAWDYQSDWYAAQISALSFNDNCVDIQFIPADELGKPASFVLRPQTKYVTVLNEVTTVREGLGKGVTFQRLRGSNVVRSTGSIEINSSPRWRWFSVENPTLFAVTVLKDVLEKNGISISRTPVDIDSLNGFEYKADSCLVVARYLSPPLKDIVFTINKKSQNLYAELLLRTLGKVFRDVGDAKHGIEVVKEVMAGFGIVPEKLGMVDGSGLSRKDLVTPKQISLLLKGMYRSPVRDYFMNSLPVAGLDGTLKGRMRGTLAAKNVRAKTGYIDRARALSGFVTTRDGELLSFAFLTNNYTVPTASVNEIQDWLCERLANFSRN